MKFSYTEQDYHRWELIMLVVKYGRILDREIHIYDTQYSMEYINNVLDNLCIEYKWNIGHLNYCIISDESVLNMEFSHRNGEVVRLPDVWNWPKKYLIKLGESLLDNGDYIWNMEIESDIFRLITLADVPFIWSRTRYGTKFT